MFDFRSRSIKLNRFVRDSVSLRGNTHIGEMIDTFAAWLDTVIAPPVNPLQLF